MSSSKHLSHVNFFIICVCQHYAIEIVLANLRKLLVAKSDSSFAAFILLDVSTAFVYLTTIVS